MIKSNVLRYVASILRKTGLNITDYWFFGSALAVVEKALGSIRTEVDGRVLYGSIHHRREIWEFSNHEYERMTTKVFRKVLSSGDTFVDIGAHIGYYTIYGADLVGENGKVIAYEPDPHTYEYLCQNVKINSKNDIVNAYNKAISSKNGKSSLKINKITRGGNTLDDNINNDVSEIRPISTSKIDSALSDIRDVDLIKIDVEGHEIDVLKGAQNMILRHTPVIVVECNPSMLEYNCKEPADLFSILEELNYSYKFISDENMTIIDGQSELKKLPKGHAINLLSWHNSQNAKDLIQKIITL